MTTSDNIRLRYAIWPRMGDTPRGTVCLVQGRTEFIEKYFETVADFQRRGFAVATFDWRGQGGSERLVPDPKLGYVETFTDYWRDLQSVHRQIILPDCPPPFYLVGHSMGGLVALDAARRDRLMFDRVFLSAPMLSLEGLPFRMRSMASIGDGLVFAGLGDMPVRRKADKAPDEQSFANNPLTSDWTRYKVSVDTLAAHPELTVESPSLRWFASAAHAMARAGGEHFPGQVRSPVLLLAAAQDSVVSPGAIEHMGVRMRTGRHTVIAGARHELFMENDAIRAQVFAAFDAFITQQSP